MDSLKELWVSLVDRFRNPLLTAFFISWLLINYKALIVLASSDSYIEKSYFIEHQLYAPEQYPLMKLFIMPSVASLFYVFIFPAISLFSTWATSRYDALHNDVRIKALRKARLSAEQQDAFKREMADVFRGLKESSEDWKNTCIKPPPDRTVKGTEQQNAFVKTNGIPENWAKVFHIMRGKTQITAKEAAQKLDISEDDAIRILIRLTSLSMMDLQWVDGAAFFHLRESSWVAFLNGRPD